MPHPSFKSVSLRRHDYHRLKSLAAADGVSIAEMLRLAIAMYEKNRPGMEHTKTAA